MPTRDRVGLVLIVVAVVATIWLGATGDLTLYIHPRYVIFTVIMAVLALILAAAGIALASRHNSDNDSSRLVFVLP